MKLAWLLAACMPLAASAQEVVRLFGKPVTAAQIKLAGEASLPAAARALRERVQQEVGARFIVENNLRATPQEIADYQRWEALRSLAKYDAEQPAADGAAAAAANAWWIELYKLKKALYEKYGGRVGITKWGPDPAGATEALLREHEKRGELLISDAALAEEFWAQLAREPRMPATRPEDFDFTYHWLKPIGGSGK